MARLGYGAMYLLEFIGIIILDKILRAMIPIFNFQCVDPHKSGAITINLTAYFTPGLQQSTLCVQAVLEHLRGTPLPRPGD